MDGYLRVEGLALETEARNTPIMGRRRINMLDTEEKRVAEERCLDENGEHSFYGGDVVGIEHAARMWIGPVTAIEHRHLKECSMCPATQWGDWDECRCDED